MFDVHLFLLMPETFLILLSGGIMLAAAISDPNQITLNWLRLCGILALTMAGLSMFFLLRRSEPLASNMWVAAACPFAAVVAHLAFVQLAHRRTQQAFAWLAFFLAVKIGADQIPTGRLIACA